MSGTVLALLAAVCFSLSYVLLRRGQVDLEVDDDGLFPNLCLGAIVLCGSTVVKLWLEPVQVTIMMSNNLWMGIGFCSISGIVGTLFGRMTLYGGIRRLGATRGIVIGTLETVVTLFLAITLLNESLKLINVLGVVLILGSVLLPPLERWLVAERSPVNYGVILCLGAAMFKGTADCVRKVGMNTHLDPILTAAIDLTVACIGNLLILVSTRRLASTAGYYFRHFNAYLWLAGVLSASGVLLFFVAAANAPISTVATITGLEPVLVALFSGLFLRNLERLTWWTAIYTTLAAIGVLLTK